MARFNSESVGVGAMIGCAERGAKGRAVGFSGRASAGEG